MKRLILFVVGICVLIGTAKVCESYSEITYIRNGTIRTFIGTSVESKPTASAMGAIFIEKDTGRIYRFDGTNWLCITCGNVSAVSNLTAPSTASAPLYVGGVTEVTYSLTVASINTNIVVAILGKIVGGGWVNLDANDDSTTITDDGDYLFRYAGCVSIDSTKMYFSSELDGTAATLAIYSKIGGIVK